LIQNSPSVFAVFSDLPVTTRTIISECVLEMAAGMKKTVNRQLSQKALHYLQTMTELEEYCYYVAGTVGMMLTKLFVDSPSHRTIAIICSWSADDQHHQRLL
jgi:farnesyl-diphosphate farnesyltransferase